MKKHILIGESGGSKTDWALLSFDGNSSRTKSDSLHPLNWEKFNWRRLHNILEQIDVKYDETELFFFGAGCNNIEKAAELKEKFEAFGFQEITVKGDLQSACEATLGELNGHTAILGSGSVFIEFSKKEVQHHFGGLGRKLGDEGGGYYFGKMVLNDFMTGKMSLGQSAILQSVLTLSELAEIKSSEISDELILQIAAKLNDNLFEFEAYHQHNFDLFFEKYVVTNLKKEETIHFVGSYAYFHEEILKRACHKHGFTPGKIVARPIEQLIKFYRKHL